MKKTKSLSLVILGILLFIPFIKISNAQGSYVGIQISDDYDWLLSVHTENWNTYTTDDLEATLANLVPLGSSNLTSVKLHWNAFAPPQSEWTFTATAIGVEETGVLLSPLDNTTITSTPVNGTFGWELISNPGENDYWDDTWYIVNDTSSFLRQTMNLSVIFGVYPLIEVLFAPRNVSWVSLVSDFLSVMSSKGGLYKNISATAQSDGFLVNIPAWGFENNSVDIDINVKYNSNGVLSYYKFSYGGQTLVDFTLNGYVHPVPFEYIIIFFVLTAILFFEIIIYIFMRKSRK
ncbi:MAG: hypothetical protein ACFFAK_00885 [Promethearchaeota archaeon]